MSTQSREHLLETCFCDLPAKIGGIQLRPLSPGSFTLLGRLRNPMMVGSEGVDAGNHNALFDAVAQYAWVHSADLDAVVAIETADDLPAAEIRKLAFSFTMAEALGFISQYGKSSLRMSASLAEVEDEDTEAGKFQASVPAGLPHLFLPSGELEIPDASDTSSGSCPSSGPSPTSTLQTSPTEQTADGRSLSPEVSPG